MSQRNLYLNNTPVDEAQALYLAALEPLIYPAAERISVVSALGRITTAPIFARRNAPLYDSAAMDGAAVISKRTEGARENAPVTLRPGEDFAQVDTGDPVRPPFDAVIMAEDIVETEGGLIQIRAAAAPWQHVRPVGEDIVQGEMILPGAHRIRPIDVGVLLSGGITEVSVRSMPNVAVFPTGDEIVEPDAEPKEGDIIESNSRMLEALIAQAGGSPHRFPVVPDDKEKLKSAVAGALADHDMVVVIAGSSAGREDYTVHALRELGEVLVHGVAMKPGKPVILAILSGKPVIGIPGYPVSAYLAYKNFALPVLERMTGVRQQPFQTVQATITRRLVSSLKHREYVRVKVGKVGDRLVASPLARGAGAAMSLVRADGFCVIPQQSEGIEAGQQAQIELTRDLGEIERMLVAIGSHDLILDVLGDLMASRYPGLSLSSTHVGSLAGLMALKAGETHIAPTHLLDEATGEYNVPVIASLFPCERMALIKAVGRTQGIMVPKGNPLRIAGVADLLRVRYINRQRGAGTRILLDHLLKKTGIEAAQIDGYDRVAATHMAVAAAVQSGSADAGMGVQSAANAMGLDFVYVGEEEYDFALPQRFLELPHVQALLALLKDEAFRQKLEELGGYSVARCGEVVLIG